MFMSEALVAQQNIYIHVTPNINNNTLFFLLSGELNMVAPNFKLEDNAVTTTTTTKVNAFKKPTTVVMEEVCTMHMPKK